MKHNSNDCDILIAGGGIAGLALAALLGRAGLSVHLIDMKAPGPVSKTRPSGRTVALMESSLNIIRAAGAWPSVQPFAAPMQIMRIVDDSAARDSITEAEFHAQDIGLAQFGFNIPNDALRAALFETVQKIPSVKLHIPGALAAFKIDSHAITATLENGKIISTRLLIGADGRNSTVRKIAGIAAKEHDYGQSAITCLINHSRAHNDTATEFHRAPGPLALVPLPGNCSSVVWIETTARADEFMRLKKSEFLQALQERSLDILGGITLEANPECWPLRGIKAEKLTAPRIALIAEAAHVISPITAQGLNLSLRDVAALAETIVDAVRAGIDPGIKTVLHQYERRRKTDINTRVMGVNGMNRIVSNDIQAIKGLRRAGLKTIDAIAPLRKTAMRIGLAPQIDMGALRTARRFRKNRLLQPGRLSAHAHFRRPLS